MNKDENRAKREGAETGQRMTMAYCRRCGALAIAPAGKHAEFCALCTAALRWILRGGRR